MELRRRRPVRRRLSRGKVFRHALRRISEGPNARSSRHDTYFTIKGVPEGVRSETQQSQERRWQTEKLRDFSWSTGGSYFAVDGGFFSPPRTCSLVPDASQWR